MKASSPMLRFRDDRKNEFPNWQRTNLGALTKWASGGTPSKANPTFWDGDIPWISAASMHERHYCDSPTKITMAGLRSGSKITAKGTILLLVRGSMLWNRIPVGIAERDLAFNQDVKALNPSENLLNKYLLQWFIAFENLLLHKVVGTGIGAGKLETDEMKELPFMLPSLPEQRKIANFLSSVDKRIEQLTQKKSLLEQYKKGAMQQIFSQQIRFKDDCGGDFPDWEEKKLGDVVERFSSGATPFRGKPDYYTGDIKWISSGELNYNTIYETNEHISEQARTQTNLRIHPPETFLMAITGLEAAGTRGSCAMTGVAATTNQSCMAIYPNELLRADFLFQWYRHFGERLAFRYCQGTKQQSYTAGILKIVPISLPRNLDEQTKIANFLSALDRKIETVASQIAEMQTFKRGLLQQMFV